MMPAHEGFHPACRAGPCLDHRLIVQVEFVTGHRLPQLDFHRLLRFGGFGHLALEYTEVVSSPRLRRIERDVGLLEQGLGIRAVLRSEGNSDAGPDADAVATKIERLLDKTDDSQRQANRTFALIPFILLNDRKFVS